MDLHEDAGVLIHSQDVSLPRRILRLPAVRAVTGLPTATIYRAIQRGEFPRQISLGGRKVGWLANEIEAWIDSRVTASRSQEAV